MCNTNYQHCSLKARVSRNIDDRDRSPWRVLYNAENRPLSFTSEDGQSRIDCDYQGRRYMKKVTIQGSVISHERYLYRGYLQIAALDMLNSQALIRRILWDPKEPSATRPFAFLQDGKLCSYGHDFLKNVTELFDETNKIATTYDYSPYGAVTTSNTTNTNNITQPYQWSSEIADPELALSYYNYRHYNPRDGRWINRDPIQEQGGWNLYAFVRNNPLSYFDYLGKAYLARRPLAHTAFTTDNVTYYMIHFHIYKAEGLSLQHSHFFLNDGTNIGYFPDGLHKDEEEGVGKNMYVIIRNNLDDCVLKKAIKQTQPKPYNPIRFTIRIVYEEQTTRFQTNTMGQLIPVNGISYIIKDVQVINPDVDNCNSWALRVLAKYDELIKNK